MDLNNNKTILDHSSKKTIFDHTQTPEEERMTSSIETFRGSKVVTEYEAIGAEADTYLVEKDNKPYFLKLYRKGIRLNEEVLKTVQSLSRQHPYFAELHEYGYDTELGRYYELSEYIEGGILSDIDYKSIDISTFVSSLNEALFLLHKNNIIHRDLKPNNILLRSMNPLDLVLIDFGVSSVISDEMSKVLTTLKGTYAYTAPEVLSGYIGTEVDYWSMGMILLELFESNPFVSLDSAVILHSLATESIDIPKNLSPELQQLLRGLLIRDPKRRWRYNEIQKWLKGEAVLVLDFASNAQEDITRKYKFKGHFYSLSELATAFAKGENFEDALKHIGRGYITKFLEKIEEFDIAIQLDEYGTPLEKLIYFIYSQKRELPFSLYGVVIDEPYLFGLLLKYVNENLNSIDKKIFDSLISWQLVELVEIYENTTNDTIPYKTFLQTIPKKEAEIASFLDLTLAVEQEEFARIKILVKYQQSIDEEALLLALEKQNIEIIRILLSKMEVVSDKNFDDVLRLSMQLNEPTIAKEILKMNQGAIGKTTLNMSIKAAERDITETILRRVEGLSSANLKNLIEHGYIDLIDKILIEKSDVSSIDFIVYLLQRNETVLLQRLFEAHEIGNEFLRYLENLDNHVALNDIPIDNFLSFNQNHNVVSDETIFSSAVKSQHIELIKYLSNIISNAPVEKEDLINSIVEHDDVDLFMKYENTFQEGWNDILYRSIKFYKKNLVKYLISKVDSLSNSLLFLAIATDQLDIVKTLVENGISVNAKGKYGDSVLMYALAKERESIAKELMENGADILVSDKEGNTLLHYAVKHNNEQIVRLLIDKGIDIIVPNSKGKLAFHYVNSQDIAKSLLTVGLDINILDKQGNSLFYLTLMKKNYPLANYLIEKGASIFTINKKFYTPVEKISQLLNNQEYSYYMNNTAKSIAESYKKALKDSLEEADNSMVLSLLHTNDNKLFKTIFHKVNKVFYSNELFYLLLEYHNIQAVRYLLDNGYNDLYMDPKKAWNTYSTPLHFAVNSKDYDLLKLLIEYGANLDCLIHRDVIRNEYDIIYPTPLELAIFNDDVNALEILLKYGAPYNLEKLSDRKIKENVKMFLDISKAFRENNMEHVEFLKKHKLVYFESKLTNYSIQIDKKLNISSKAKHKKNEKFSTLTEIEFIEMSSGGTRRYYDFKKEQKRIEKIKAKERWRLLKYLMGFLIIIFLIIKFG